MSEQRTNGYGLVRWLAASQIQTSYPAIDSTWYVYEQQTGLRDWNKDHASHRVQAEIPVPTELEAKVGQHVPHRQSSLPARETFHQDLLV